MEINASYFLILANSLLFQKTKKPVTKRPSVTERAICGSVASGLINP
jgi:hypothetical protein